MGKITFTIADLIKWGDCVIGYDPVRGYDTLANHLNADGYGTDSPITLIQALESSGIDDCLWAAQEFIDRNPGHSIERDLRLFACDCAERVLPIFEKYRNADKILSDHDGTIMVSGERGYAAWASARSGKSAAAWALWHASQAFARAEVGIVAEATVRAVEAVAWDAGDTAGAREKELQTEKLKEILKRYSE